MVLGEWVAACLSSVRRDPRSCFQPHVVTRRVDGTAKVAVGPFLQSITSAPGTASEAPQGSISQALRGALIAKVM